MNLVDRVLDYSQMSVILPLNTKWGRDNLMEHVSKLGEAIVDTVTAAQAEDGAELAKSIVNIVANAGGIIQDIAHAFGY